MTTDKPTRKRRTPEERLLVQRIKLAAMETAAAGRKQREAERRDAARLAVYRSGAKKLMLFHWDLVESAVKEAGLKYANLTGDVDDILAALRGEGA